jgi:hypothetical protein
MDTNPTLTDRDRLGFSWLMWARAATVPTARAAPRPVAMRFAEEWVREIERGCERVMLQKTGGEKEETEGVVTEEGFIF